MRSAEYFAATTLLEEAVSASSEPCEAYSKATALTYLGRLAIAWGEYDQARDPLDRALDLIREVRPRALILPLVARARLARAEGERDLARRLLQEAVEVAHLGGDDPARAFLGMGDLAADEGDRVAAQRMYEEAVEFARADHCNAHAAEALNGLARLARGEGASEQASRFQSQAFQLRHESREARGLLASLEVTARVGRTSDRAMHAAELMDAADALREANSFEDSGSAVVPYESRGESGMDGWDSLTKREHEVAALVAEGMTNQGIAERLIITLATVKNHLSHIFAKLKIAKRSELAEEVWRRRRGPSVGQGEAPDRPRDGLS